MIKARVVARIVFRNLITEKEIGYGIFSRSIALKKGVEPGSEISLPVGNQKTRNIFGKGPHKCTFKVKEIIDSNGETTVVLAKTFFPASSVAEFEASWSRFV